MRNDGSLYSLCACLLLVTLLCGSVAGWSVSAVGEQLRLVRPLDVLVNASRGAGVGAPTCLPPQYPTKLSVCPETECIICYTTGQTGETVFNTTCSFAAEVSEWICARALQNCIPHHLAASRGPQLTPTLTEPFSLDALVGQSGMEQRKQCVRNNHPCARGTLP